MAKMRGELADCYIWYGGLFLYLRRQTAFCIEGAQIYTARPHLFVHSEAKVLGALILGPFCHNKKTGTIFRYDFVAGGQIIPKKCLCDRIEKDGWDGHQGQKFVRGSVYL